MNGEENESIPAGENSTDTSGAVATGDATASPVADQSAAAAPPRIRIGSQRPGATVPTAAESHPRAPRPTFRHGKPPRNLSHAVSPQPADVAPPQAPEAGQRPVDPLNSPAAAVAADAPRPDSTPATNDSATVQKPVEAKSSDQRRRHTATPNDAAPAAAPGKTVARPSVRDQMTAEMEREIEDALGGMTVDDVLAGDKTAVPSELEPESRVRGRVASIHGDSVFFELGGRNQGVISQTKFNQLPAIGAVLDLEVVRFDADEGLYELSLPGAAVDVGDWSQVAEGMVVDAQVTGHNKGGLECQVSQLRGFIPAGQISQYRVEDFAQFVGQTMTCVITEANPERRNLVLSRRAILERDKAEAKQRLLGELAAGQIRDGVVRSLQDFGEFVDLGGIDGLIHVSQLSWDRVKHPSEVLEAGQKVRVKIQKVDPTSGKISLAYRDLMESPWTKAADKYPIRSTVKGTVSKLMDFGAFVRLEPGVEGLIHISELAHKRVIRAADVVSEGQEVDVLVVSVDAEAQRIGLSLKALQARPMPNRKEPAIEEPVAPLPQPKRKTPLKGGIGGKSGGEQFGLRW